MRLLTGTKPCVEEQLYVDQTCPSCGSRLAVTSPLSVTCVACWNCRLFPNPNGRLEPREWSHLVSVATKAETVIDLLATINDETQRAIVEKLSNHRSQHHRSTRENIARLFAALQETEK